MKKILLTVTYFGSWPKWFPAFLASCAANRDVDWLFLTDCECGAINFPNIRVVSMSMEGFNRRASDALGISVRKLPYSQLDLRPAYGHIFRDFYEGYDFWGHVDVDVVWGNIRKFVTDKLLDSCDILSGRQNAFAGHFTVYRNNPEINAIYRRHPDWEGIMTREAYQHFDEKLMGIFFKYGLPKDLKGKIRVQWSEALVLDWWALANRRNGWEWRNGALYDGQGKEHMYIHFMTWKPHMRHIDFRAGELPESFRVTHRGIWSKAMTLNDRLHLRFPIRFLAESYSRYIAWYWLDQNKWLRFLRPGQHARRDQSKK